MFRLEKNILDFHHEQGDIPINIVHFFLERPHARFLSGDGSLTLRLLRM